MALPYTNIPYGDNTYVDKINQNLQEIDSQLEGILKDNTKTLNGLTVTAIPDDVITVLSYIPDNKALVIVRAKDTNGNPASVGISGGLTAVLNEKGYYATYVTVPSTLNCNVSAGIGYTITTPSFMFSVTEHKVYIQDILCATPASGETEITVSGTYNLAPDIVSIDACVIGGGGAGYYMLNNRNYQAATGGAGGFLTNVFNINTTVNKTMNVIIGAGGGVSGTIGAGGTSSITIGGVTTTANGGGIGNCSMGWWSGYGASGGSGSGSSMAYTAATAKAGYSGLNGSGGETVTYNTDVITAGTGQGSSTRKFGEAGNTLYCGAGGGACVYMYGTTKSASGGSGGGGAGVVMANSNGSLLVGNNATAYGGGGGAVAAFYDGGASPNASHIGKGYQGVVFVRWRR